MLMRSPKKPTSSTIQMIASLGWQYLQTWCTDVRLVLMYRITHYLIEIQANL
ncbi:hypothetical protein DPMN_142399 [Dreissena polymorpha]|uniref:Uncharacterized protein n=1 Tax=Dreissena polymorpha TaxID=45954 RepID=A0A9D4GED7_DREPO|nr:hypothetical protein DPMN_142399 [Dreissena polymorpha]